ncbi:hypothetical protein Tco_1163437 [Tanacetum coccineum]
MRVVDITPPLTPFSYLDPQFLGLKAREECLAFILSVAFKENDWNYIKEDLFYKADKEKVKDCFKHLKSSGLSVGIAGGSDNQFVVFGTTSALSESRLQHNIHSSKHIVVIRAVRCHWRSTKGYHASAV